ncbi:MAG: hypothetical protein V1858_01020 [Candidatus Gottesmanbacteria bacterium]
MTQETENISILDLTQKKLTNPTLSFDVWEKLSPEMQLYSYGREKVIFPDSPEKLAIQEKLTAFITKATESGLIQKVASRYSPKSGTVDLIALADMRVDGPGHSRKYGWKILLDTPHAIILKDKSCPYNPLAVVGLKITVNEITIGQIQGIKKADNELRQVGRWEKILVGLTEEAAKEMIIPRVRIITAKDNGWIYYNIVNGFMDENSAKLRYDITAKRMGYKWDGIHSWVKELNN